MNALTLYGKNIVVSADNSDVIHMWRIRCGTIIMSLVGHSKEVTCLDVKGVNIVSGSKDNSVIVWNGKTGSISRVFEGHTGCVTSVAISFDTVVSGSVDKTIKAWCLDTGVLCYTLSGHAGIVSKVIIKNDMIYSCSHDATLKMWELYTGELKHSYFPQFSSPITKMAVSDSKIMFVQIDNKMNVMDIKFNLKTIHVIPNISDIKAFNNTFIISSLEGFIYDYEAIVGNMYAMFIKTPSICCIYVAEHIGVVISGSKEGVINTWGMNTGRCLKSINKHDIPR